MSSKEETENYFIGTIKSLQTELEKERNNLENEKKKYENEINELKKQISEKNNKRDEYKNLEKEKEKLENEKKNLNFQIKNLKEENNQLKNVKELEINKNKELIKEKKELNIEFEKKLQQKEEDKNGILNQFKIYQQKKENEKEEYKLKLEKLEDSLKKEKEENENKIKNFEEEIKKLKKKNKELIDFIKSEKEKKDSENEKELNILSNTEKNNDESQNNINNDNNLNNIDEKKLKQFSELLCEFLLYLNNSKFNLSIFEMINQSITKFEMLDFFSQLDINSLENFNNNNVIEDNLFKFFLDFKSFILIYGEKSTLNNFLNQNVFKYKNISNNDIDLIKKITNLKICNNIDIKNEYELKKETYYKTINLSFDLLKNKIISKNINKIKLNDIPLILKTKEIIKEFNINLNDINIYKFNNILNFQYKNLFKNIEKLSIKISEVNLPLLYNILIYCENLKYFSLEIIESPDSKKNNNKNIVLQQILSFILKSNLLGVDIKNLNLNDNIQNFTNSLQNSKLNKLSLINTYLNKQNFTCLSQYFKNNLNLKSLNLSYLPNINLISILNDSLFLSSTKLEELYLINNNFNNEEIEILCKYLHNQSINYLNLSKNKLNQLSCSYLGVYFSKDENLLSLNLSDCNLNEENIQLVFKKECLKKLKYLNLDNNKISNSGLITLGNFILKCLTIEEISICNCSIGENGMILFINFLINKKNLKLYLLNNIINENIIKEIEKNKKNLIENNIKIYCSKNSNLKENEVIIIQ